MSSARVGICLTLFSLAVAVATLAQEGKDENKKTPTAEPEQAQKVEPLFNQRNACSTCHVEASWFKLKKVPKQAFDHSVTGFPLTGQHGRLECKQCHRRGLEALNPNCFACHKDPHAGANTTSCDECHTAKSWDVPRNFFVHERTRFPLTGVHASLACESCHRPARGEALAVTPTECGACHVRQLSRATPNHPAAGFTECGWCHTTSSFRGAIYTHNTYILDGAHALQRCTDCHTGTVFTGLANGGSDCISCHQAEFNSTATLPGIPDHTIGAPFGSDCNRCHQNVTPPITFQGAVIN